MSAKSSFLAFRPAMPTSGIVRADQDRRPTEAECEYVRARARQAALAIFEAKQRRASTAAPNEVSCE